MIIRRFLSRTDDEITIAIYRAFNAMGIVIPSEITLRPTTKTRLIALNNNWKEAQRNRIKAMALKTMATAQVVTTKADAELYIRHFIMVYNLGVDRTIYTKPQRIFFHLDKDSDKLPDVGSTENIILWGKRIVNGDAKRVAAGGAPMANPSAAEVDEKLRAFINASNNQSLKTSVWKDTLQVLVRLRKEAKVVIKKIWDETETFYSELPPPAMRDKGRLWGIVYKSDTEMTINLLVINNVTNLPIQGAVISFAQSGTTHITNQFGNSQFKTTVADVATLTTIKAGFKSITTEINFENDVVDYDLVIRMEPV